MRNFFCTIEVAAKSCSTPKNYNWMLIIIMLMVSMDIFLPSVGRMSRREVGWSIRLPGIT